MASYTVASQEGADFHARKSGDAAVEVGAVVDLKLDPDEERAVVAAGWLEHAKKSKEEK